MSKRALHFLTALLFSLPIPFCRASSPANALNSHTLPRIAVSENHTCIVNTKGNAVCWYEEHPSEPERGEATPPADLGPIKAIYAGSRSTCAIKENQEVACWGDDYTGQTSPPKDLGPVLALSLGDANGCAIKTNEEVVCWGSDGSQVNKVPNGIGAVQSIAVKRHACAVKKNGKVVCWGDNLYHHSDGLSPKFTTDNLWVRFDDLNPPKTIGAVRSVSLTKYNSYAIKNSGDVVYWGESKNAPPSNLGPVLAISSGTRFACAIDLRNQLRCWHAGRDQTDYGPKNPIFLPPSDLGAVKEIACGEDKVCALRTDNQVICWSVHPGLVAQSGWSKSRYQLKREYVYSSLSAEY